MMVELWEMMAGGFWGMESMMVVLVNIRTGANRGKKRMTHPHNGGGGGGVITSMCIPSIVVVG